MQRISKEKLLPGHCPDGSGAGHLSAPVHGAIIVKNDEIISTGYNGAPRGGATA